MAWTLCTSGAAIAKAGSGANAVIVASGATLAEWSNEVEGTINARTRKDWVADFASVTSNFQGILKDTSSDLIAMKIICFSTAGYSSRREAELMLDVLRDNAAKNMDILVDDHNKEVMD